MDGIKPVFEQIADCINIDLQKGKHPKSIVVNHVLFFELCKIDLIPDHSVGDPYKGVETYSAKLTIGKVKYPLVALPDFHPDIQAVFRTLGKPVVSESDFKEQKSQEECAVLATVDEKGELIILEEESELIF